MMNAIKAPKKLEIFSVPSMPDTLDASQPERNAIMHAITKAIRNRVLVCAFSEKMKTM